MIECNAKEVREYIKDILSLYIGKRKVFSNDVAAYLQIPYNTYITGIKRNSIPYREILMFCKRTTEQNKVKL